MIDMVFGEVLFFLAANDFDVTPTREPAGFLPATGWGINGEEYRGSG